MTPVDTRGISVSQTRLVFFYLKNGVIWFKMKTKSNVESSYFQINVRY